MLEEKKAGSGRGEKKNPGENWWGTKKKPGWKKKEMGVNTDLKELISAVGKTRNPSKRGPGPKMQGGKKKWKGKPRFNDPPPLPRTLRH